MAFSNWTGAIEGTLRKQDYQIKRLELELVHRKYQAGEIGEEELEPKQKAYATAENGFKAFWNAFRIGD